MLNADPTGEMPNPDAGGCVALTETNQNYVQSALVTFIVTCLAIGGIVFWMVTLKDGDIPPNLPNIVVGVGITGIFGVPVVPVLLINMLFPPRLRIDDVGVHFTRLGRTKQIAWQDVLGIDLCEVSGGGRSAVVKTKTIITSPTGSLRWMPLFGIAPHKLAAYIRDRQRRVTGLDVDIGVMPLASGGVSAERKNFDKKVLLPVLIIIGVAAVLAIAGLFIWISSVVHATPG